MKQRKGWRIICDVGKATDGWEEELCSDGKVGVWALLWLTMSSAHSPTFPSLHLRHNSFSNPSVALPTSQLILQPFRRFTYVTAHSPTLPSLHLRHSSFSNSSFASPTSQALHLIHLASSPCLDVLCILDTWKAVNFRSWIRLRWSQQMNNFLLMYCCSYSGTT